MSGRATADGFETAYREHYAAVRRYAAARFGEGDADDIAQETMLRAWARFDEIAQDGRPLSGWLTKVATDLGIDHHRKTQRMVVDGETVRHATAAVPDESARVALQADTRPLLKRALGRLTPGERLALGLHAVADAGIGEIAAATGMTANAVRQRLFRARRNLRRHYSQLGGHDYASLSPLAGASRRAGGRDQGGWLMRTAHRLAGLHPTSVPVKPAVAVTVLVALVIPPGAARVPVRIVPRAPGIEAPSRPGGRPLPVPSVPDAVAGVRDVRSHLLGGVVPLARGRAFRIEAESGLREPSTCGSASVPAVQPKPGASGGRAVVLSSPECWLSFAMEAPLRVASIRYRTIGLRVCGHFEISGAITGLSGKTCSAAGTWLLVPVDATSGTGGYDVSWVADGPATSYDIAVDLLMVAPDGVGTAGPQCSNGVDDDGDGHADYPKEPACADRNDDDEKSYGECDNGVDDDGDGWADYPEDNGCGGWDAGERCVLYVKEQHAGESAATEGAYGNVARTVTCVTTSRKPLSVQSPRGRAVALLEEA